MSEILTFPSKIQKLDEDTPLGALTTLCAAMQRGDIDCDQMVVTWCKQDGNSMSLGFKVAGDESLTSAVGLLELTKAALME